MKIYASLMFILFFPFMSKPQLWTTLNPLPTPNSIHQVEFISQDTGFITGGNSTFLGTTDGGLSWKSVPYPIEGVQLSSLNFFGKNLGILVSWSHIYITTDGGNSWTYKKKQLNGDYTNSFFINDTIGWLCGTYQIVTKTTDGGLTWQTLSNNISGAMHYFDIEFATENTGYVAGYSWDTPSQPVLKRSDNGGRTWHEVLLPADVYKIKDIFVISEEELWIAVGNASLNPGNDGYTAKAYHSSDGGNSWVYHDLGLCYSSAGISRIHFEDDDHGWAMAQSHIYITEDGGQNWVSKLISSNMFMPLEDCSNPIDSIFYVVSTLPEILKTTDNGTTWNSQVSGIKGYFNDIRFSDNEHGLLCGFDLSETFIYKTDDGGTNWIKTFGQSRNGIQEILEIAIPTPGIVYALGNQDFILKSKDAGNTWLKMSFNSNKIYKHIAATDSLNIILGAIDGSILKTIDGGFSWYEYQLNQPSGYTLYNSFEFIDNLIGYATLSNSGSLGKLMVTDDGGLTWRISDYGSVNKIISISCSTNNTCLISIANEGLSKTVNAGQSWEPITTSSDLTNTIVKVFDDLTFLAAFRNTLVAVSFDGGNNWEVAIDENPQGGVIKKHLFISPSKGWNIGTGNLIQAYFNPTLSLVDACRPDQNEGFIYPNPSTNSLQIKIDTWKTIAFFDIKGRKIKEFDFANRYQLNQIDLPSGIYFVELLTQQKRHIQKLLIL
ncbi:MAG: hypothetical protein FD155_2116 [Bacteroidetes bacterium]|nr:MAG: hypothetical protein FD155_2116 [Bacteroidota bacterium]